MGKGDHIKVFREEPPLPYWHHGIDVGGSQVVSVSPDGVLLQSVREFSGGLDVVTVVYKPGKVRFTPDTIAFRARACYEEHVSQGTPGACGMPYNLASWNCEHFAIFCCTGVALSRQVADTGRSVLAAGLVAALLAPPVGLAVAGLGGFLLSSGGTRELICGTARYVP